MTPLTTRLRQDPFCTLNHTGALPKAATSDSIPANFEEPDNGNVRAGLHDQVAPDMSYISDRRETHTCK
jgi:hypothetical protein